MMSFMEWLAHLHFSDKKFALGMLSYLGIFYSLLFSYFLLLAKTQNQCHAALLVEGFLQRERVWRIFLGQTLGFPACPHYPVLNWIT